MSKIIQHFSKGDTRAASKRLAEIRERERLAMPVPRDLVLNHDEMDARIRTTRHWGTSQSITAAFCGDPEFFRSALGGWIQRGNEYVDAARWGCGHSPKLRKGKEVL